MPSLDSALPGWPPASSAPSSAAKIRKLSGTSVQHPHALPELQVQYVMIGLGVNKFQCYENRISIMFYCWR
jgi:hypothetical protein